MNFSDEFAQLKLILDQSPTQLTSFVDSRKARASLRDAQIIIARLNSKIKDFNVSLTEAANSDD